MFLIWGIYNWFEKGLLGFLLNKYMPGETGTAAMIGGAFALCIVVSYLVGSINFALVISKLFFHDDVRQHGSGNAGATNMTRTYGKKAGVLAFFGDGFKGVFCIVFASLIFGCPFGSKYYIFLVTAAYLSAFICVVGHVFPCFSRFQGGKGFATTALSIIALNPFIAAILCFVFFPLVAMTKYISLGSVITVLFYPIILARTMLTATPAPVAINAPGNVQRLF